MSTQPTRRKIEPGIYERNGKLEIAWRDAEGKQRRRAVHGGILAARNQLAAEVAKRASGERVAADARLRFDVAADAWQVAHVARLRSGSQATYRAHLRHLRKTFGRQRMAAITTDDVARYVAARERDKLSGKTIGAHLSVLSAVFDYAGRRLGLAGANPVKALNVAERPSDDRKRDVKVLTPEELRSLVAAVEERYRLIFEFAAQTGARIGEALGLAWGDLNLDAMTVSFTHQLERGSKRRVPLKTKASKATLEIGPSLVAKLKAHKIASPRIGADDLVFTSRIGTPLEPYNISYRVMGRAARRAGIVVADDERLSFHCLRHGFGSQLIAAGCDIAEVQRAMRHKSAATTLAVYTHEFDAAARSDERRARLERIYGDGSGMAARGSTSTHRLSTAQTVDLAVQRAKRTA